MHARQSLRAKPLKPRQLNALQMVLDGYTGVEIQERLGITQKTLWNWRQLPAWEEQISLVLREASGDGQGQIKSMLPLATSRLKKLIFSTTETVALGACRTVLEAHANLVAREEQQEAMAQMERDLGEIQAALASAKPELLQAAAGELIEAEIVGNAHVAAQEQPAAPEEAQP